MLKLILDSLDGLDDATKALYTEKDGKFHLNVEGIPDVAGLKAKADELLREKKELQENQKKAISDAVEAALEDAKKSGDAEAIGKSWEAKYNAMVAEKDGVIDSLNGTVTGLTSGSEATKLAASLAVSGSADALLPHIAKRLKTEMVNGIAKTIVLDADGKASAATLEELSKELKANSIFAPLIAGSKGNGKGITQQDKDQAGPDDNEAKLSPTERITRQRERDAEAA